MRGRGRRGGVPSQNWISQTLATGGVISGVDWYGGGSAHHTRTGGGGVSNYTGIGGRAWRLTPGLTLTQIMYPIEYTQLTPQNTYQITAQTLLARKLTSLSMRRPATGTTSGPVSSATLGQNISPRRGPAPVDRTSATRPPAPHSYYSTTQSVSQVNFIQRSLPRVLKP